jgi:hypothetical protein
MEYALIMFMPSHSGPSSERADDTRNAGKRLSGLAFWRQQSDVCVRLQGRRAVMSRSFSEPERAALAGEIAALQTLDIEQLRARWRTLYKTEAPSRFSRDLLMGAVAYRLQGRRFAGSPPEAKIVSAGRHHS